MTDLEKFYTIIKRYKVFITKPITPTYLEELLVKFVMLPAYEKHKDIPFEEFIKKCIKNPIGYLLELSYLLENSYYDIHLLNNCFNDGSDVHYGAKIEGKWYFITHRKNLMSLPLYQTEFKIKPKDLNNISYLTSYEKVCPNILKHNVGSIRKNIITEYQMKYFKKTS